MPIYKWRGEYWYGYGWPPSGGTEHNKKGYIRLWTRIKEKGEKYGFEVSVDNEKDPIGTPILHYSKKIWPEEQDDPEVPKNYPGDYYWVWYNGAFFKVLGETEKYVLVDIEGWNFEQADALGINREDVIDGYHQDAKVGKWWIKKSEIKMPDEFGKGRYIYLEITQPFYMGIYEIIKREGDMIRVRCSKIWIPTEKLRYIYEEIEESIKKGTYPWRNRLDMIKEMAEIAEGEVWIEGERLYCEATFDLKHLREYRAKIKDEKFGVHYLDFYLYGEEDVPYRL